MKQDVIIKTVTLLALPFIFMFGLYVLFHGKVSPGGGFQGGAIWATGYCLYAIVFSHEQAEKLVPYKFLKITACIGAFVYCVTGFVNMYLGGRFLDYNTLAESPHSGQFIGVMIIESGVQLAVFGALSLIFIRLSEQD